MEDFRKCTQNAGVPSLSFRTSEMLNFKKDVKMNKMQKYILSLFQNEKCWILKKQEKCKIFTKCRSAPFLSFRTSEMLNFEKDTKHTQNAKVHPFFLSKRQKCWILKKMQKCKTWTKCSNVTSLSFRTWELLNFKKDVKMQKMHKIQKCTLSLQKYSFSFF